MSSRPQPPPYPPPPEPQPRPTRPAQSTPVNPTRATPVQPPATLESLETTVQMIHRAMTHQAQTRARAGRICLGMGAPLFMLGGLGTFANLAKSADGMQVDAAAAISLVMIALVGIVLMVAGECMRFSQPQ